MTENNKLYKALEQLQFTGKVNDDELKTLEKEIFTDKNLENIKADEGSDLYNFLNNDKCTIDNTINNAYQLSEIEITNFLINNKVYENDQLCSKHGFFAALLNRKAGHFCTYKNEEVIFNSSIDGRQFDQCCGIHAIEGVLIAEALKSLNDNDEKYNDFVTKYKNAFLDDEKEMTPEEKANREKNRKELKKIFEPTKDIVLEEQRKILFKMEILDALNNLPETVLGTVYSKKEDGTYEINGLSKLYKLYFEEFQARCAALQAVKQELGLKLDKVKLDKVPEAPKVEALEQSDSVTQQQIQQKDDEKEEAQKVEIQQDEIKKEDAPEVKTEAQKPVHQVVVEESKKEEKPQMVEKQDKAVDTQKTTEEQEIDTPTEPNPSMDSQSSTSSILSEHPNMKPGTIYNWTKEEDTGIKTYDIEDNKISEVKDINKKAAKLYLDILKQVIHETYKKGNLETITEEIIKTIREQTEDKVDACFTIRDENNNIVENLTEEDKTNLDLAKKDYKERAKVDEQVIGIFNQLNELKNIQGAAKEIENKLLQKQTIASKE